MQFMAVRNAVSVLLLAAIVAGCAYDPIFSFPSDVGDVTAGRQAFIDHQCHQCHSIAGVSLPPLAGGSTILLELGGETAFVKSEGELLTSIINPNHSISERYREQSQLAGNLPLESPMPMPHIDNMTVRQLIDIVAFLDSRYILTEGYTSNL